MSVKMKVIVQDEDDNCLESQSVTSGLDFDNAQQLMFQLVDDWLMKTGLAERSEEQAIGILTEACIDSPGAGLLRSAISHLKGDSYYSGFNSWPCDPEETPDNIYNQEFNMKFGKFPASYQDAVELATSVQSQTFVMRRVLGYLAERPLSGIGGVSTKLFDPLIYGDKLYATELLNVYNVVAAVDPKPLYQSGCSWMSFRGMIAGAWRRCDSSQATAILGAAEAHKIHPKPLAYPGGPESTTQFLDPWLVSDAQYAETFKRWTGLPVPSSIPETSVADIIDTAYATGGYYRILDRALGYIQGDFPSCSGDSTQVFDPKVTRTQDSYELALEKTFGFKRVVPVPEPVKAPLPIEVIKAWAHKAFLAAAVVAATEDVEMLHIALCALDDCSHIACEIFETGSQTTKVSVHQLDPVLSRGRDYLAASIANAIG